jgi:hypothetical protein
MGYPPLSPPAGPIYREKSRSTAIQARPIVFLHLDAENDRDREAILAHWKIATGRNGALGSIITATVRRALQREITRQRPALRAHNPPEPPLAGTAARPLDRNTM